MMSLVIMESLDFGFELQLRLIKIFSKNIFLPQSHKDALRLQRGHIKLCATWSLGVLVAF